MSRRTFLRGAGAAIALPWLDAMVPGISRAPELPVRSAFLFLPNGIKMDEWTPSRVGVHYDETPLLAHLRAQRDSVHVISGLALDGARNHGDGPGDHARASAAFLTCAHPFKTGGADIRVGVSIDQVLASRIGDATAFPSLELGTEGGRLAGVCDSGYSCAYSNNVSWRTPSTPVVKETDPRAVFTRLFGDPDERVSAAEAARRRRRTRSVLDAALDDWRGLRRDLAPADRRKLDEYLTAVREIEARIDRVDREAAAREAEQVPTDVLDGRENGSFPERLDLMYDLLALAFRTDRTRVATFMLGNAGSNRTYPDLDVHEGHHTLSHHRSDKGKLAAIGRINHFHLQRFARFLGVLDDCKEGDSTLLRQSAIVLGSGIGDGNRHNHDDLPVLVAGRAGGRLRPGRHTRLREETPMADLYLAVAGALGVELESFGDSTGVLPGVLA